MSYLKVILILILLNSINVKTATTTTSPPIGIIRCFRDCIRQEKGMNLQRINGSDIEVHGLPSSNKAILAANQLCVNACKDRLQKFLKNKTSTTQSFNSQSFPRAN